MECSGFWLLQMGEEVVSIPGPDGEKTFARRDDVLSCGHTECAAPGEMSGGQQNADLKAGRVRAKVLGGLISSEMASKDVGAKSRPPKQHHVEEERMLCL